MFKLKKFSSIIIAAIMLIAAVPQNVMANAIAPRAPVSISMTTSADSVNGEVEPGEEITVTVDFRSTPMPTGEPITIRVTEGSGARILIEDVSDVVFLTGGVQRPVSGLIVSDDSVFFRTGAVTSAQAMNQLTFTVKAPVKMGTEFELGIDIFLHPVQPNLVNHARKVFNVSSGFTIDTTEDVILNDMPFEVFGEISLRSFSGSPLVAVQAFFEDGTAVFNIADTIIPNNNSFNMGPFTFPRGMHFEDGMYTIVAYLYDADTFELIAEATKVIEYMFSGLISEVSSLIVTADEPFFISGEVRVRNGSGNYMVVLQGFHEESGDPAFNLADAVFNHGDTFKIGPYFFPSYMDFAEGRYLITMYLYNADDFELLDEFNLVIEFRR